MHTLKTTLLASFALALSAPIAVADATAATKEVKAEPPASASSEFAPPIGEALQNGRISLGTYGVLDPTRPNTSFSTQGYSPEFAGYAPTLDRDADLKLGTSEQFSEASEYQRDIPIQDPNLGFGQESGNFEARLRFNWPRRR